MSSPLIKLAETVLMNYNITPESIKVIQSGGIKTVWKIETSNSTLCLKRLRQTLDKCRFTIYAQNYMAKKGAKVPAIYAANDGELYSLVDNQIYVLYQWVEGKNLYFSRRTDLEKAVQGIAAFHRDSAGYLPPNNCTISSKLGRWPHYYESLLKRLKDWKQIAAASPEKPLSQVFSTHVDHYIMLGEKALELLATSHYKDWVTQIEMKKNLCHQDYGDGNALLAPDSVYVIDLDGVTYDLPARDLRKIINKRMNTRGKWDIDFLQSIINWYCQVNPLTEAQIQVLYIDLLFPHEFHDTAKNPYKKNKPISASKLMQAVKHEQGKEQLLLSLINQN